MDHLGTPRVLTDENGDVISTHAFFPFGEEVPGPDSIAASSNTHWFTGHERDKAQGTDYMLARQYSPYTARFTTPDPARREITLGGGASAYAYVGNTPLMAFDPTGEERTSTVTSCLAHATSSAGSILAGTLAVASGVAPEPLFTKVGAIGFAAIAYNAGSMALSTGETCRRLVHEDKVIADCIESGTRTTCEEAKETCDAYRRQGSDEPADCERVRKRLSELESREKSEEPPAPCPRQPGGAGSTQPCPNTVPIVR